MVSEISLQNVRVFKGDLHRFPLKALTLFTGTNSSGKSTLLKILPLLRQSQGIREYGEQKDGSLRLKGGTVDLGNFQTIVSDNDARSEVTVGFSTEISLPNSFLGWIDSCAAAGSMVDWNPPEQDDTGGTELTANLTLKFGAKTDPTKAFGAGELKRAEILVCDDARPTRTFRIRYERESDPDDRFAIFKIILPKIVYHASPLSELGMPESATEEEVELRCQVRGLLPAHVFVRQKGSEKTTEQRHRIPVPLPPLLDFFVTAFKGALRDVHYLGPLRSSPKRFYLVDLDGAPSLDAAGEFVPYVLRDEAQKEVHNCAPGKPPAKESLQNALSNWLQFLRSGVYPDADASNQEFELSRSGVLAEFKVRSIAEASRHGLIDSGFGYSQILPVIIRCLLADRGDTVVIEQPELHLHPALQVRLADFFVGMVNAGKQIIIETHSEHLVNSLRALVAEQPTSELAKMCSIFFLEATCDGVKKHNLLLGADGMLNEWPRAFFGDAVEVTARILRAQKKRLREKK